MGVSLARINIGAETAYVAGVRSSCDKLRAASATPNGRSGSEDLATPINVPVK